MKLSAKRTELIKIGLRINDYVLSRIVQKRKRIKPTIQAA